MPTYTDITIHKVDTSDTLKALLNKYPNEFSDNDVFIFGAALRQNMMPLLPRMLILFII